MSNDDLLWAIAGQDAHDDVLEGQITQARITASEHWPFLAAAASKIEYEDRKALVADRLERVAASVAGRDPVLFGVLHSAILSGFDEDYRVLSEDRRRQATLARAQQAVRKTAGTYPNDMVGWLWSLKVGDPVVLHRDGHDSQVTVQRTLEEFGSPQEKTIIVGYGPGRFNQSVSAAGIAAGYYDLRPADGTTASRKTAGKAARDVAVGDVITSTPQHQGEDGPGTGGTVAKVRNSWGQVFIWFEGSDLDEGADVILNHGDPVKTASRKTAADATFTDSDGDVYTTTSRPGGIWVEVTDAEGYHVTQGLYPGDDVDAARAYFGFTASRKQAEDAKVCATCGASIERDPKGEDNRTWHHNDGASHDHEATPKTASRKMADWHSAPTPDFFSGGQSTTFEDRLNLMVAQDKIADGWFWTVNSSVSHMPVANGYADSVEEAKAAAEAAAAKVGTTASRRQANQYVQKQGDGWVVVNKSGKVISHHDSQEKAEASFRAMEMGKHSGARTGAAGDRVGGNDDIAGAYVVLAAGAMGPEYQDPTWRVFYCEGGFGSQGGAIGSKVFGRYVRDGERTYCRRPNIDHYASDEEVAAARAAGGAQAYTGARKTAGMTVADAPIGVPLVAVDGQYAGMPIAVTQIVMPETPPDGWTSTAPGYALGTVTFGDGSQHGASFPLDVTVRTAARKRSTLVTISPEYNGSFTAPGAGLAQGQQYVVRDTLGNYLDGEDSAEAAQEWVAANGHRVVGARKVADLVYTQGGDVIADGEKIGTWAPDGQYFAAFGLDGSRITDKKAFGSEDAIYPSVMSAALALYRLTVGKKVTPYPGDVHSGSRAARRVLAADNPFAKKDDSDPKADAKDDSGKKPNPFAKKDDDAKDADSGDDSDKGGNPFAKKDAKDPDDDGDDDSTPGGDTDDDGGIPPAGGDQPGGAPTTPDAVLDDTKAQALISSGYQVFTQGGKTLDEALAAGEPVQIQPPAQTPAAPAADPAVPQQTPATTTARRRPFAYSAANETGVGSTEQSFDFDDERWITASGDNRYGWEVYVTDGWLSPSSRYAGSFPDQAAVQAFVDKTFADWKSGATGGGGGTTAARRRTAATWTQDGAGWTRDEGDWTLSVAPLQGPGSDFPDFPVVWGWNVDGGFAQWFSGSLPIGSTAEQAKAAAESKYQKVTGRTASLWPGRWERTRTGERYVSVRTSAVLGSYRAQDGAMVWRTDDASGMVPSGEQARAMVEHAVQRWAYTANRKD